MRTARRGYLGRLGTWLPLLAGASAAASRPARGDAPPANNVPSVLDFGARAVEGFDNSDAFEAGVRTVSERKLGTLLVPPGEYELERVVLRDGVMLRGAGRDASVLLPTRSDATELVGVAPGPARFTGLREMALKASRGTHPTNPGQWAMRFVAATGQGREDGGIWWSTFADLQVFGFENGIGFLGGPGSHMLPHQFITLSDILVYVADGSSGPALAMTGQVDQIEARQIHLDCLGRARGPLLLMAPAEDGATNPCVVSLQVITVQSADLGVGLVRGQNISIRNSWFENVGVSIRVGAGSKAVKITENRFANAAEAGSLIEFDENATGSVADNLLAGPRTRAGVRARDGAGVEVRGNTSIWGASALRSNRGD